MAIVNHDYPVSGALTVVDSENAPIEAAQIRIYDLTAFQAGVLSTWQAATSSDMEGKWVDPITLPDGRSWVVYMEKQNTYGPNHIEITT